MNTHLQQRNFLALRIKYVDFECEARIGVDFCGDFSLHMRKRRKSRYLPSSAYATKRRKLWV